MVLVYTIGNAQKTLSAKTITNRYFEAIGGKKKWSELKTRISHEKISLYQGEAPISTANKFMDYYKCFLAPNSYMDTWYEGLHFTSLCETSGCKWLYSDNDMTVRFLNKKHNREATTYPRIEPLEILNFQMIDSVILENNFYRIDFRDTDWRRIMSVYFDKENYLIRKHSYSNNGVDRHEYYYSDYRVENGFFEPYFIENYIDGRKYKTIEVQSVDYNSNVDPSIFELPVKCENDGTVQMEKRLLFPFRGD
jgi:hypothetical protein